MNYFRQILVLLFLISTASFSQTKIDTLGGKNEVKEKSGQINQNAGPDVSNGINLFKDYFSVPLNLKIHQKILSYDFAQSAVFSPEELRTGMSREELTAFEKHKLNTQRILSGVYGEDLIDVEGILSALGITRDQIIAVAAILRFFMM